ncbi:hypothetical protein AB205_0048760 [Aquarana catesbeiana]|uniref:MADF domain-containing protein n=1 Tax=Aquarana catesbeiana TaxID=8400 RepID=A0A2G9QLP2_AQUCT|nr:hypothetical protein AB205_0048760 [Aquarana catesbeiana]
MKQFKDPEFMGHFIDKYKDMCNLWEVKNTLYHNKPGRKASLEKLLQFVKTQVPNADIEFVEKNIGSLRSTYRKELNIQASIRSGAAAVDVYVPSLWYYNRMQFPEDQMEEDLSQDEALECGTQEEVGVSVSQEVAGPSSYTQSQVPPLCLQTKMARKESNVEEQHWASLRRIMRP